MAEQTGIEWCDATFNPWWGCEKVSPGCAHCYADTLSKRYAKGVQLWGDGHEFRFFGDAHWNEPLKWARLLPAKLGRRPRVFCASMADVFEERDELQAPRDRLFELIENTPELDWLVLTKRPEFARDWLGRSFHWRASFEGAHPNLWMGVSIENARFTWRADVLREIPAAVRFLSCEPLLGSLFDVRGGEDGSGSTAAAADASSLPLARRALDLRSIDWVIVGGESGPGARPMQLEWACEIRDACFEQCAGCMVAVNTIGRDVEPCLTNDRPAVFVKQLGAKPHMNQPAFDRSGPVSLRVHLRDKKGGDWNEWPADLRIREFPQPAAVLA